MPQNTLNSDIAKLVEQLEIIENIPFPILSRFADYIHRTKDLISKKKADEYALTNDIIPVMNEVKEGVQELQNDITTGPLYSDDEITDSALPFELKGFSLPDDIKKLFIETILKRFYQNNYSVLLLRHLGDIANTENTKKVDAQLEILRKLSVPKEAKEAIFKEYIDTITGTFYRTPIRYTLREKESYTDLSVWLNNLIDILGIRINRSSHLQSIISILEENVGSESFYIIPKISKHGEYFDQEFIPYLIKHLETWDKLPTGQYAAFLYNLLIYTIRAKIAPLSIRHDVEVVLKLVGNLSEREAIHFLTQIYPKPFLPIEQIKEVFIHLKNTGYIDPNSILRHPIYRNPVELTDINPATSEYIQKLTNKIKEYEPLSSKQIVWRDLDQSAHATDKKGTYTLYNCYNLTKHSATSSNIAVKIESQGEKGEIRYYELITILRMLKNNKLVQDYLEGLPCMADLKGANLDTKDYIELNFTLIWNALSQPALSKTAQLNLYDPLTHEKITWTDIEPVTPRQPQPNIIPDHQIKDQTKPLNAQFFSLNLESGKPSESASKPPAP